MITNIIYHPHDKDDIYEGIPTYSTVFGKLTLIDHITIECKKFKSFFGFYPDSSTGIKYILDTVLTRLYSEYPENKRVFFYKYKYTPFNLIIKGGNKFDNIFIESLNDILNTLTN